MHLTFNDTLRYAFGRRKVTAMATHSFPLVSGVAKSRELVVECGKAYFSEWHIGGQGDALGCQEAFLFLCQN